MRAWGLLRFWLLISVALASHLALDALNNYGVHPFYPFDATWYFGDALFIFEPSVWLILGVAVAWNGRSRAARLAAALPLVVLVAALASTGIVPRESVAALALLGGTFAWIARNLLPAVRAVAAFAVCLMIVAGFAASSRVARSAVVDVLSPEMRGELLDIALTPNPSSPLCWGVIAIEMRETSGEYVLWKGTLSLAPGWRAATACASHSYYGAGEARSIAMGRFVLEETNHQPLPPLRALAGRNCWVQAWLRFGRVPVIDDGWIFDLRYGQRRGQNFTHMALTPREGCPGNVPAWSMPRADLLKPPN
jgi:inner membrane protein